LSLKLADIFRDAAVESFGNSFRIAVTQYQDYASLVKLRYVESPEAFSEALSSFLRRFDAFGRRHQREGRGPLPRPSNKELDRLMELSSEVGVSPLVACLISHALVEA